MRLRIWLAIGAALGSGLAASHATAQPYPNRVIKIIVPFAAGGPADTLARIVANRLSGAFGQGVILDNRPGAGGTTGAKVVATAEPDGYTLLYGNTASLVIGRLSTRMWVTNRSNSSRRLGWSASPIMLWSSTTPFR